MRTAKDAKGAEEETMKVTKTWSGSQKFRRPRGAPGDSLIPTSYAQLSPVFPLAILAALAVQPSPGFAQGLDDNQTIFERRDNDLITERRDPDLLRPFDQPTRREPLIEGVERAVDRGEGRIEDERLYELDRIDRERDPSVREYDKFQIERDRDLRLQQRADREARGERVVERESERLADERAVYLRSLNAGVDPGGAVDDARKLKRLDRDLDRATRDAERRLARDLKELDKAKDLPAADRDARRQQLRDEHDRRLESLRRDHQAKRNTILGEPWPAAYDVPATQPVP